MANMNWKRIHLGTLAGGAVWSVWSLIVNVLILPKSYAAAQAAGTLLKSPHYTVGGFLSFWFLLLFVLSSILSWLYASVRGTLGAGPRTALKVGFLVGFSTCLPLSWSLVNWSPLDRFIPLWWMLDLWVGSILAALVAGWLYKD